MYVQVRSLIKHFFNKGPFGSQDKIKDKISYPVAISYLLRQ